MLGTPNGGSHAITELLVGQSSGTLGEEQIRQLTSKYLEARKRGSPREFESVLDQLDFLVAMAEASPPMATALTTLRQTFQKQSP